MEYQSKTSTRYRQNLLITKSRSSYAEIPKRHVIAALELIKSSRKDDVADKKRRCRGSLAVVPTSSRHLLMRAQRKAILRHDWETAINCLHLLLDHYSNSRVSFRQFISVLFNHSLVTPDVIQQFLSETLNLITRQEQSIFISRIFNLSGIYRGVDENLRALLESEDEFDYDM